MNQKITEEQIVDKIERVIDIYAQARGSRYTLKNEGAAELAQKAFRALALIAKETETLLSVRNPDESYKSLATKINALGKTPVLFENRSKEEQSDLRQIAVITLATHEYFKIRTSGNFKTHIEFSPETSKFLNSMEELINRQVVDTMGQKEEFKPSYLQNIDEQKKSKANKIPAVGELQDRQNLATNGIQAVSEFLKGGVPLDQINVDSLFIGRILMSREPKGVLTSASSNIGKAMATTEAVRQVFKLHGINNSSGLKKTLSKSQERP